MKLNRIIVSDKGFSSDDPYDLVYSNITVVNLLREEGIEEQNIHDDAMTSYYIDYYLAEYNNGNFSQFVWNTSWEPRLIEAIKNGLQRTGARKHLNLFMEQCAKVNALPVEALQAFLAGGYFGANETRDSLNNDTFFDLDEDLIELNAKWLKSHPDLKILSIDNMFRELEQFIGRKIER